MNAINLLTLQARYEIGKSKWGENLNLLNNQQNYLFYSKTLFLLQFINYKKNWNYQLQKDRNKYLDGLMWEYEVQFQNLQRFTSSFFLAKNMFCVTFLYLLFGFAIFLSKEYAKAACKVLEKLTTGNQSML